MKNKILSVVKTELSIKCYSKKYLFVFLVICVYPLFCMQQISTLCSIDKLVVLDGLFYQYGLYINYYLVFVPLYILLSYDLAKQGELNNYIFLRVNQRKTIILSKMLANIFLSIIFVLLSVTISFMVMRISLPYSNTWSSLMLGMQQASDIGLINSSLIALSPITVLGILIILEIFSYIAIGQLILLLVNLFRHEILAFISAIILNFVCLIFIKMSNLFDKILIFPYQRMFLNYININNSGGVILEMVKIVGYWLIIIGFLGALNIIIFRHKDFLNGEIDEKL